MSDDPDDRWDHHYRAARPLDARAAEVLAWNHHLLPDRGDALDVAAGLGANAFVLARQGLAVEAWDLSGAACRAVAAHATQAHVQVRAVQRDVIAAPPKAASFDVIVVSAFLHRALCPFLVEALRPGGVLFYQTFCRDRPGRAGPTNPDFLLEPGELLERFGALAPLVYREEGRQGDPFRGFRDRAMFVGRKPDAPD